MILAFNSQFNNRKEISQQIGGNTQKGITKSSKTNTILLFVNKKDYILIIFIREEPMNTACILE